MNCDGSRQADCSMQWCLILSILWQRL